MAALASTDVTISITKDHILGKQRRIIGTITFGDGSLTYPTGGVPLPAYTSFNFKRGIDTLSIHGVNGLTTDYMIQYDKTNHKLLMYEEEATAAGGPLLECDTSEAPAARTYLFEAAGW